jgi:hypothetical protein
LRAYDLKICGLTIVLSFIASLILFNSILGEPWNGQVKIDTFLSGYFQKPI